MCVHSKGMPLHRICTVYEMNSKAYLLINCAGATFTAFKLPIQVISLLLQHLIWGKEYSQSFFFFFFKTLPVSSEGDDGHAVLLWCRGVRLGGGASTVLPGQSNQVYTSPRWYSSNDKSLMLMSPACQSYTHLEKDLKHGALHVSIRASNHGSKK